MAAIRALEVRAPLSIACARIADSSYPPSVYTASFTNFHCSNFSLKVIPAYAGLVDGSCK